MNKRIVFTADVQLHQHADFSTILPNGRNSRLQNGLDCLLQAAEVAGPGGTVVVNGDLFHDRKQLDIGLLHDTHDVMLEMTKTVRVILSVGNHDQYLRSGARHSLAVLGSIANVEVVDRHRIIQMDGVRLHIVAFRPNLDEVREFIDQSIRGVMNDRPSILVLHAPVLSAQLGGGRFSECGLSGDDLRMDYWAGVVLGHYHKPQQLFCRHVWYVGSPYQVDWSEAGDAKRFLVWDGEKMEDVPVTGMPQFRSIALAEWLLLSGPEQQQHFYALTAQQDEPIPADLPPNVKVGVMLTPDDGTPQKIELSSFDVTEAVRSWLTDHGHPELIETALGRLQQS